MRKLMAILLACLMVCVAPLALADDYPTQPVTCIMAAAAGGGTDLQVRAIAPFFSKYFGQELIPTAMPGGSGTIGMTYLADSTADGYTIGVPYTGGVCIMPGYGQTTYTPESFRYICQYSNSPLVLVVNAKGNIQSVEDLVAYGKNDGAEGIIMLMRLVDSLQAGEKGVLCTYSAGGQGMAALVEKL